MKRMEAGKKIIYLYHNNNVPSLHMLWGYVKSASSLGLKYYLALFCKQANTMDGCTQVELFKIKKCNFKHYRI